ncbi:MAG: serine/threonine-protein kinase [Acidimicrobiales bacterium]
MMPDESADLVDGRYRIGAVVGRGAMGDVFAGEDIRLRRPVAIKLLRRGLADDPAMSLRFAAEARAAARVIHPNVVAIFDTGLFGGTPFIVMECLPGRTLADEFAEGRVPQDRARKWILQVLGALGAAHAAGVIHRDIKPSNILLSSGGDAKVADFGIAKVEESADVTGTGLVIGTAAYLAPERVAGQPASVESDVYAAGVVLYEALSGVRPFVADTPLGVLHAIAHLDVPPLTGVAPDLAEVAARAMAKDPTQRYSSAAAMASALGDRTVRLPTVTPQPSPTVVSAAPGVHRWADAAPTTVAPVPPRSFRDGGPAPHEPHPGVHAPSLPLWAWGAVGTIVLVIFIVVMVAAGGGGAHRGPTSTAVSATPASLDRAIADLQKEIRR